MQKIRLAVIDQHEMFRRTLSQSLGSESDIDVVLDAEDGRRFIEHPKSKISDVLLIDVQASAPSETDIVEQIVRKLPHLKIVLFSKYDIDNTVVHQNLHRVRSFIEMADDRELLKAIRFVSSGGTYSSERIHSIIAEYLETLNRKLNLFRREKVEVNKALNELPEIEHIILAYLLRGYTSVAIGNKIHLSHRTVENRIRHIYRVFQVHSKQELIDKLEGLDD